VLLDEAAAEMLDEQSGALTSGSRSAGVRNGLGFKGASGDGRPAIVGDTGGASRFFYITKASRDEREAGCETANHHPTVKPIELATYLARMLLPPPGPEPRRILVPFGGSGSEMIGAVLAGWDEVVGVEMSEEYIAIATARLKHWAKRTAPKKKTTKPQLRKRTMPVQMEMFG
jgi:site-specific DNA-methyltransferase (adenine-specific)